MGKYKQERKDLFKDMSGGYNAMGDSNSPNYQYNGSAFKQRFSSPMEKQGPLHGNAFGHAMQKTGGDYDKAKSMLEMKGSPMHKSPYKVIGDPNKKMDRLSAKHKSLYDRFEMGQTSEKEEQRMFRLEDRMDKVGKKIKSKKSPLNQGVKEMSDKDVIKSKNKKVIKETKKKMTTARGKTTSTKKTMTTGRGKTTKSPLNQGNGGTRNSGDAQRKMSPEEEAKLRTKNIARKKKKDDMIADKKAKGVYPKDK